MTLQSLLDLPDDTAIIITDLKLLGWGRTLVFTGLAGEAGDQPFELRYDDCRELRWRIYVSETTGATPLVSFAPGRDQQRSPAQILTDHFGLSLYYGSVTVSKQM